MSVYTNISQKELEIFLFQYALGDVVNFVGINAGIENTNFALTTTQGEFILTIYETQTAKELQCVFDLLEHLSQNAFPSPIPQPCIKGFSLKTLKAKPAAIFARLPGKSIELTTVVQCEEIGHYLAKLHFVAKSFLLQKQHINKLQNWQSTFNKMKFKLAESDIDLLDSELKFQLSYAAIDLPKGVIHADLFTDNVLFKQGKISGIIDFYNASHDFLLFDIAVTVNDWCIENSVINPQKLSAFISGYQTIRLLTENEKSHLSIMFRLAALRFWVSRLEHQFNPKPGLLTLQKDPDDFRRILNAYRANPINSICEYKR